MLQILDNLRRLFIFFNDIGEIDQFHWTFWEDPALNAGPSEKILIVGHRPR